MGEGWGKEGRGSGEIQTQENVKLRWNAVGIFISGRTRQCCLILNFIFIFKRGKGEDKTLKEGSEERENVEGRGQWR